MLIAVLMLLSAQLETFRIYGHVFTLVRNQADCVEAFSIGYVKQHGMKVSAAEIEALRKWIPASISFSRPVDSFLVANASIFKAQRAIYRKHRGRVALAFPGIDAPIAIDAMVAEMQQLQKSGHIAFDSASIRKAFFQRLMNIRGAGLAKGKNADEAFIRAPWELKL